MKHWILVLLIGLVLMGCATPMPRTERPAYRAATLENQTRILAGKIGMGMSIEECKVSWPNNYFEMVRASNSARGRYELWKVDQGEAWLYLHIYDGRIESISEYPH